MLAIPERVLAAFEVGLHDFHVPVPQHNAYKKWLRFYWDFCKKYQFAAGQQASLSAFLQKLRSKKQSEEQCLQAQAAIEPSRMGSFRPVKQNNKHRIITEPTHHHNSSEHQIYTFTINGKTIFGIP